MSDLKPVSDIAAEVDNAPRDRRKFLEEHGVDPSYLDGPQATPPPEWTGMLHEDELAQLEALKPKPKD